AILDSPAGSDTAVGAGTAADGFSLFEDLSFLRAASASVLGFAVVTGAAVDVLPVAGAAVPATGCPLPGGTAPEGTVPGAASAGVLAGGCGAVAAAGGLGLRNFLYATVAPAPMAIAATTPRIIRRLAGLLLSPASASSVPSATRCSTLLS